MKTRLTSNPYFIILMATMMCHGLLPFTDYIVWDDLWMMNWIHNQKFSSIQTIYSEVGGAQGYYYMLPFTIVGDLLLTEKILGLVSALLFGLLVFKIGKKCGLLDSADCLIIALVTVSLPAYKFHGGCIYTGFVTNAIFFLSGVLAALHSQDHSGWRHLTLRALAIGLFLVSFVLTSLLAFYGGFFLLMVLVQQRRLNIPWYHIPWTYLFRMSDFFLLPFLYWMYKRTYGLPHGRLVGYNEPSLRSDWIINGYKSLPEVFSDPLFLIGSQPLGIQAVIAVLFFLLIPVVYYVFKSQPNDEPQPAPSQRSTWAICAFGAILLLLATVPYVVIGRTFSASSQSTTYASLIPIPAGILAVALSRLIGTEFTRPAFVRATVFAAALAVWTHAWWHNYLSLQAMQVRNAAVMRQYHADPMSIGVSFVRYKTDLIIERTPDNVVSWVWTYLDCGIAGTPRSIALDGSAFGLPVRNASIPESEAQRYLDATNFPYALTTIDLKGRQADVLVERGPGYRHPLSNARRYLYFKYFRPQDLDSFLEDQVRVKITYPTVRAFLSRD